MAKVGEGDPRWVVADRADGKNVNAWHWSERDVSTWARAFLTSRLSTLTFPAAAADVDPSTLTVDKVEGDAHLYNRKGTLKPVYDLKVTGKWTTSHATLGDRSGGVYKFELFDDDPEVTFGLDSTTAAVVAASVVTLSNGTASEGHVMPAPGFAKHARPRRLPTPPPLRAAAPPVGRPETFGAESKPLVCTFRCRRHPRQCRCRCFRRLCRWLRRRGGRLAARQSNCTTFVCGGGGSPKNKR